MRTVVLFDTVIGTSNQGDLIIYRCLEEELKPFLNTSYTVKYGTHIQNYSLPQYLIMRSRRRVLNTCDYKIIMGTNLLSYDLFKSRRQWILNFGTHFQYRRAVLAGVGTTQKKQKVTPYTRFLYDRILNKTLFHSVRDSESAELLEGLGFHCLNTGCPTLWKMTPEFCRTIPKKKAEHVVFTVSGYASQRDPERDRLMLRTLEEKYDQLYFWNQTIADLDYLQELCPRKPYEVIFSLDEYQKILSMGNIDYVGTRLHGGVYALRNRARTIVISIDHRAKGFHMDNHLPTLERENIRQLGAMIDSEFETEIQLNAENIARWKSQFPTGWEN